MAIQEIGNVPTEKYFVRGWREGEGDPRIDIEVRPGSYQDNSVLDLSVIAEAARSAAEAAPGIITVEVRKATNSANEVVIPAP